MRQIEKLLTSKKSSLGEERRKELIEKEDISILEFVKILILGILWSEFSVIKLSNSKN